MTLSKYDPILYVAVILLFNKAPVKHYNIVIQDIQHFLYNDVERAAKRHLTWLKDGQNV